MALGVYLYLFVTDEAPQTRRHLATPLRRAIGALGPAAGLGGHLHGARHVPGMGHQGDPLELHYRLDENQTLELTVTHDGEDGETDAREDEANEQGDGYEYDRIFWRFAGTGQTDGSGDPCFDIRTLTAEQFADLFWATACQRRACSQ